MNLLETLQKLLNEVGCMTTLLSFSRQITEERHGDLTGKKMTSLSMKDRSRMKYGRVFS